MGPALKMMAVWSAMAVAAIACKPSASFKHEVAVPARELDVLLRLHNLPAGAAEPTSTGTRFTLERAATADERSALQHTMKRLRELPEQTPALGFTLVTTPEEGPPRSISASLLPGLADVRLAAIPFATTSAECWLTAAFEPRVSSDDLAAARSQTGWDGLTSPQNAALNALRRLDEETDVSLEAPPHFGDARLLLLWPARPAIGWNFGEVKVLSVTAPGGASFAQSKDFSGCRAEVTRRITDQQLRLVFPGLVGQPVSLD